MKLIIAFIRPESLQHVKQELYTRGIYSMSVTNILGAGRQKGYTEMYRGVTTQVHLLKKLRLEIGLHDADVDNALEGITLGARTGQEGDGVYFVMDVTASGRIRTDEPL